MPEAHVVIEDGRKESWKASGTRSYLARWTLESPLSKHRVHLNNKILLSYF